MNTYTTLTLRFFLDRKTGETYEVILRPNSQGIHEITCPCSVFSEYRHCVHVHIVEELYDEEMGSFAFPMDESAPVQDVLDFASGITAAHAEKLRDFVIEYVDVEVI